MNKITVQGNLETEQLVGSSADIEKKIISDLDAIQTRDGKKPFSKISDQVVVEPYRDGAYSYHARLSEAATMYDLSPEIQRDAQMDEE